MFRRFATAACAAGALSFVLAGCGEDAPSSSSSGSSTTVTETSTGSGTAGGDAVAWAEKVCQSVEDDIATLKKTPDVDPSDPQKAKDSLVTYLGGFATALDNMSKGIKDAGDPPVEGGAEAAAKATEAFDNAKQAVEQAKSNLEQASVSDPAALQAAFTKVGQDLASLSDLDDPTKDLEANAALKDAFDQAPTCKKMDETLSGDSSSTPTS